MACSTSSGSKPATAIGLLVLGGDELERPRSDDGRDVARADEPVQTQVGRVQQRAQRRHDRDVVAHAEKLVMPSAWARLSVSAVEGAVVSKPMAKKTTCARGWPWPCAGRPAASRPSGCRRPQPWPPAGAVGARDAEHVAEAREDDVLVREGDRVVHAAHRDDAHRTTGSVHELDVRGKQIVDAVLVDGMGVPAAHLHELVVPPRLDDAEDLAGDRAAQARRRGTRLRTSYGNLLIQPGDGGAGVDQTVESPGATGATRSISTVSRPPSSSAHSASPRSVSTRTTSMVMATSPHVMQCES